MWLLPEKKSKNLARSGTRQNPMIGGLNIIIDQIPVMLSYFKNLLISTEGQSEQLLVVSSSIAIRMYNG